MSGNPSGIEVIWKLESELSHDDLVDLFRLVVKLFVEFCLLLLHPCTSNKAGIQARIWPEAAFSTCPRIRLAADTEEGEVNPRTEF
jgi:hypothetical protein